MYSHPRSDAFTTLNLALTQVQDEEAHQVCISVEGKPPTMKLRSYSEAQKLRALFSLI